MVDNEKETLEILLKQINELLDEIKDEQEKMQLTLVENHKVNMKKFSKLLEYDEICDMTNTLFEARLAKIEKLLYEVFKS